MAKERIRHDKNTKSVCVISQSEVCNAHAFFPIFIYAFTIWVFSPGFQHVGGGMLKFAMDWRGSKGYLVRLLFWGGKVQCRVLAMSSFFFTVELNCHIKIPFIFTHPQHSSFFCFSKSFHPNKTHTSILIQAQGWKAGKGKDFVVSTFTPFLYFCRSPQINKHLWMIFRDWYFNWWPKALIKIQWVTKWTDYFSGNILRKYISDQICKTIPLTMREYCLISNSTFSQALTAGLAVILGMSFSIKHDRWDCFENLVSNAFSSDLWSIVFSARCLGAGKPYPSI